MNAEKRPNGKRDRQKKAEKRRDGKVKITLNLTEVFPGYRDAPEFKKLYGDIKRRNPSKLPPIELVHKAKDPITVIFPSPEFCLHLLNSRRAWGRFLHGIKARLSDAYGIREMKGKRRRATNTHRETCLEFARGLYPCIHEAIKKDPALAGRIATKAKNEGHDFMDGRTPAQKNYAGLTRYVIHGFLGEITSSGAELHEPGTPGRKDWVVDLLNLDKRTIRRLGLSPKGPKDPFYAEIATELMKDPFRDEVRSKKAEDQHSE